MQSLLLRHHEWAAVNIGFQEGLQISISLLALKLCLQGEVAGSSGASLSILLSVLIFRLFEYLAASLTSK